MTGRRSNPGSPECGQFMETQSAKFTHKRRAVNNSPSRTCNNRKRNRSTCSGAIRAAASIPDSTAKDLRSDLPDAGDPAEAQRFELQPVPAHRGPGLPPTSRCVPRLDGYNTSHCKGKAWERGARGTSRPPGTADSSGRNSIVSRRKRRIETNGAPGASFLWC